MHPARTSSCGMRSAPARYRFMLGLAHFVEPACVAAYAAACRAAACEVAYVLELYPSHPGHQGYVRVLVSASAGWLYELVFPRVPRSAMRRATYWLAGFLDLGSVVAYAAVSRVNRRDHVFILAQYAEHPSHRGGLRWPRRRVLTASQVWSLGVSTAARGVSKELLSIGSSSGRQECPGCRRVRARFY